MLVDYVTFQNASLPSLDPFDRAVVETVVEPQNVRALNPCAVGSGKARHGLERTIHHDNPALFTNEADADGHFIKNGNKVY
jgi:hypothetical protein